MFRWTEYEIPPLKSDPNEEKSNTSNDLSLTLTNAVANCTNKYLHKKFKKVVAFHSNDSELPTTHPSQSQAWNINGTNNSNGTVCEERREDRHLPTVSTENKYKFINKENKVQSSPPLTSIYKPKFHKASIYIKNDNTSISSTIESPNQKNDLETPININSLSTVADTTLITSPFTSGSGISESKLCDESNALPSGTRISKFAIPLIQNEPDISSMSLTAFSPITDLKLQPSTQLVNYKFASLPSTSVISKSKSTLLNDISVNEVLPFDHGMPILHSVPESLLQYDKNPSGSAKRKIEDITSLNDVINVNYSHDTNLSPPENIRGLKIQEENRLPNANKMPTSDLAEEYPIQGKDPKYQLEREVARSLLSLSRMCHQTVSKPCTNAEMVTLNTSPNTFAHSFSLNQHLSPTSTVTLHKPEMAEKVIIYPNIPKESQPDPNLNQIDELTNNERFYFEPIANKNITPLETIGGNSFVERTKIEVPFRNNNNNYKENLITESKDSASVIMSVGSSNFNTDTNASKKLKTEFASSCSGPLTNVLENGQTKCGVCHKVFNKPSQLKLHVNIHYFEQPFRCDSCAVSFRTKGHLHKHLGSNSHLNKLSLNSSANGQTSANNPRPFKCDDCNIGFRIHGHLAKHLRSKMHITKLECVGKLPFGTYAEMERCGINMNDIDTTDCENSLQSLQKIAIDVIGLAM